LIYPKRDAARALEIRDPFSKFPVSKSEAVSFCPSALLEPSARLPNDLLATKLMHTKMMTKIRRTALVDFILMMSFCCSFGSFRDSKIELNEAAKLFIPRSLTPKKFGDLKIEFSQTRQITKTELKRFEVDVQFSGTVPNKQILARYLVFFTINDDYDPKNLLTK
jgi:hypothetical protein